MKAQPWRRGEMLMSTIVESRDGSTAEGGGVRAVTRAFEVLQSFTADRPVLSVAEIVRESGLPRTTVLRLIDTLVGERMLRHAADGRITVGARLIRLAAFAEAAWAVPEETAERMTRLAQETGETASLYVRSGLRRVAVAQSPSPYSLRHVVQVGDEMPLLAGASSTLLAAASGPDAAEQVLASASADEIRRVDADAFRAAVAAAARDRHAVSHGAREPGNSGVAVIVREGDDRRPAVVLGLGGPTARFTEERVAMFLEALEAAASDLRHTGLPPALD
ncbi:DNA-binding IclR family transcriptional regulator [Microbacterium sp. 1154]|uniref:IclR family transcriptional regulator n=1 Tax=Microbacterium sp. 1154 TaxID=2817733 RepID=UPI0028586072|nr:helix-turn-helix domain-containing protein [Microbacterium sp. 1154]MDR6690949.1 DNA-binding IclR family transcriptional regulator [Microbacterium sp. 1154]